jgi:hypothetical protein
VLSEESLQVTRRRAANAIMIKFFISICPLIEERVITLTGKS